MSIITLVAATNLRQGGENNLEARARMLLFWELRLQAMIHSLCILHLHFLEEHNKQNDTD